MEALQRQWVGVSLHGTQSAAGSVCSKQPLCPHYIDGELNRRASVISAGGSEPPQNPRETTHYLQKPIPLNIQNSCTPIHAP